MILIGSSEAEITTGIICSCLPTLPALYQHYVPKMGLRITLSWRTNLSSHSTKSAKISNFSSCGKMASFRNRDSTDPQPPRNEYLELGGVAGDSGFGGLTTRIEGGVDGNTELEGNVSRSDNVFDNDTQWGQKLGIIKSIRLERITQPVPRTS